MAISPQCTHETNGFSSDLFNVQNEIGVGVYHSPLCFYQRFPATPSITLLANAQTPAQGGYFTLNFPATPYTINNQPVIVLDCLRAIALQTTVAQNETFEFLISGFDDRKVPLQKVITYTANSTGIFSGENGFMYVASIQCIYASGAATSTISFGTSNVIALPGYALASINHIIQLSWNNTFYGGPSGNALNFITPAFFWRNYPTTTLSDTSSDARGLITLPSNPDGVKLFTILYYVYGVDSALQTYLRNGNPQAQQLIGGTGYPAISTLINFDETGMQYPADYPAYAKIFNIPI